MVGVSSQAVRLDLLFLVKLGHQVVGCGVVCDRWNS